MKTEQGPQIELRPDTTLQLPAQTSRHEARQHKVARLDAPSTPRQGREEFPPHKVGGNSGKNQ
eukprot:CAMPEP_0183553114 /NCGR_PEP_ID=MMETSP0371-20130417/72916_1 /TAXON_ID=268820 /ORGANISM="Peridinium aciculiferum, Strain PAER-2" /LENGTH=62 /DNA_ID=CAMNT_0025758341 /DNA_START=18 /DNA_END=207 /DNA_ORIENTATION=-